MKLLILLFVVTIFGCQSTKKAIPTDAVVDTKLAVDSTPTCIKNLIEKMKTAPVPNPPHKIYSYTFNGKKVFYVPAVCCDMFSDLYNDSCQIMGHPDGGFTGRGDGKIKDFDSGKSNELLIWADDRK